MKTMPTLIDFLDILETVAPARWAEPWDNPGLQVGSPTHEIRKILVSLDPTWEALRSASAADAQVLFTHHPLIFKPLSHIQGDVFPGNVILEAIRKNVAVVAAHTNLDVAPVGINTILADLLDLREVEVLKPLPEDGTAGLGRIGDLPSPARLQDMARRVAHALGMPSLRVVGDRDLQIRRIAVVGGAGSSLISLARKKGADLLLTGDVGHHAALEARALGIALLDGGHFHTEKTAFYRFSGTLDAILKSKGWDVEVIVAPEEEDPVWRWNGT